ncbi:MAG: DUF1566 domain-containing protein [Proteobacteria bacterium]|nr:DUF1566 domain-containing protein [Pseudomonadota bacterium]
MGVASTASASLINRGNGMIYDTDRNITWLSNANLAATNTFGVGGINAVGQMIWTTAESWVTAMDTASYLGFTNWRLPTTPPSDATCTSGSGGGGYTCTHSELGHLFYQELGGVAAQSILTNHNSNFTLFSNIQSLVYWSGTEKLTSNAWSFTTANGFQGDDPKSFTYLAWAVRTGDVASEPEPGIIWLLLAGGLGWVGTRARRRG